MDLNLPKHHLLWWLVHRRGRLASSTFVLGDTPYSYFVHPFNHTWNNERAVEIPPLLHEVRTASACRILEIGNVLSHYGPVDHDVLDKYERSRYPHLIRQDLVDFRAAPYDLIVSISTLEHIGHDESPSQPEKVLIARDRVRSLLAEAGKAVVTVPIGYNAFLDGVLRDEPNFFDRVRCLRRRTEDNEWEECDLEVAVRCSYGTPFRNANAVVFGEWEGGGGRREE